MNNTERFQMNNTERFQKTLSFQSPDRLPMIEWATWWTVTIDRWKSEGLPEELTEITDITEYFGLDVTKQFWLRAKSPDCPVPSSHGAALINSPAEYQKFKDENLLFPETSFDENELAKWQTIVQTGNSVIWATIDGFFWFPRALLGIEKHMYAFYDCPELIHQMNQDLVDYYLAQWQKFTTIATPAFMTFAEDMSYNHGPMLSKDQFDEFLAPYYNQIVDAIKEKGTKVFVDSDGDVTALIPWLKSVGVEGILPLERMAGVDVAKIREDHPEFLMIGGFDKTIMHKGKDAMRAEFERLLPTMQKGGFIPSVDHQTPPDVSLQCYKDYIELYNEYTKTGLHIKS
jgi:hypothetical protein